MIGRGRGAAGWSWLQGRAGFTSLRAVFRSRALQIAPARVAAAAGSSQLPGASCPLRSASPRAARFALLPPPPPWRLPLDRAPPMSDSDSRTEKRKVKYLRIRDGWKTRWSHTLHLLPASRARAGLDTRPRPACRPAGGGDRSGSGPPLPRQVHLGRSRAPRGRKRLVEVRRGPG